MLTALLLHTLLFAPSVQAQPRTTMPMPVPVSYVDSKTKTEFAGQFLPAPTESKTAPGVLIIHNWLGVTDETLLQAKRFQALGYNVFVADIYGATVRPKNPQEAGAVAGSYKSNRKLLRERVVLALEAFAKQKGVDRSKMAVAGYCFGGTSALEIARAGARVLTRSGVQLGGVISFHGGLDSPTPMDGKNIRAKVLALHGAIDPFVSAADLAAFESEMKTHKVDYELIHYSGTVHSFTDTTAGSDLTKGAAFNAQSDARSFARARDFLAEIFAN